MSSLGSNSPFMNVAASNLAAAGALAFSNEGRARQVDDERKERSKKTEQKREINQLHQRNTTSTQEIGSREFFA